MAGLRRIARNLSGKPDPHLQRGPPERCVARDPQPAGLAQL